MSNSAVRNILYIFPSYKWNTKERRSIQDMIQARDHGYNVLLLAYEDSFIATVAKQNDIEVIVYKDFFLNKFSNYHKYVPIRHILKHKIIDIVHFYHSSLLCSLAFQLKGHSKTALTLTQSTFIDKSLKYFWYKPFIARLDSLLLGNKNLLDDAQGNLGLDRKRIEYFGVGIRFESILKEEEIDLNFELYKNYFLAATYVSPGMHTHVHLSPLLHALKVINLKIPAGVRTKLVLISPLDFQNIDFLPKLMKEIQDLGLEEDVLFVSTKDIVGVITHFDLWISNSSEELIEDHALCALTHEVPVILTRNFCANELLSEYEGVGETYKLLDARELRDKWEKIIMSHNLYLEKTRLYKFFIEREHSFKNYRAQLMSLYSRTIGRRMKESQSRFRR